MDKKDIDVAKKENRRKYDEIVNAEQHLKKIDEAYNDLVVKMKKEIDNVFLYWTGESAINYISEANDRLATDKKKFDVNTFEQLKDLQNKKEQLNSEYSKLNADEKKDKETEK